MPLSVFMSTLHHVEVEATQSVKKERSPVPFCVSWESCLSLFEDCV